MLNAKKSQRLLALAGNDSFFNISSKILLKIYFFNFSRFHHISLVRKLGYITFNVLVKVFNCNSVHLHNPLNATMNRYIIKKKRANAFAFALAKRIVPSKLHTKIF